MFILSSQLGPFVRRVLARAPLLSPRHLAPLPTSSLPLSISPSVARPQIGAQTDAHWGLGGAAWRGAGPTTTANMEGRQRDETLIWTEGFESVNDGEASTGKKWSRQGGKRNTDP